MTASDLTSNISKFIGQKIAANEITLDSDVYNNTLIIPAGREKSSLIYDIFRILDNINGTIQKDGQRTIVELRRTDLIELQMVMRNLPTRIYDNDSVRKGFQVIKQLTNDRSKIIIQLTIETMKIIRLSILELVRIMREYLNDEILICCLYGGGVGCDTTLQPYMNKCIVDECNLPMSTILHNINSNGFLPMVNAENAIVTSNRDISTYKALSDCLINSFTSNASFKHIYESAIETKKALEAYKPIRLLLPVKEHAGIGVTEHFTMPGLLKKGKTFLSERVYYQTVEDPNVYKPSISSDFGVQIVKQKPTLDSLAKWIHESIDDVRDKQLLLEKLFYLYSTWDTPNEGEDIECEIDEMVISIINKHVGFLQSNVEKIQMPERLVKASLISLASPERQRATIDETKFDTVYGFGASCFQFEVAVSETTTIGCYDEYLDTVTTIDLDPHRLLTLIGNAIITPKSSTPFSKISSLKIKARAADINECLNDVPIEVLTQLSVKSPSKRVIGGTEVDEEGGSSLKFSFMWYIKESVMKPLMPHLLDLNDLLLHNKDYMSVCTYRNSGWATKLKKAGIRILTGGISNLKDKEIYEWIVLTCIIIPNILRNGTATLNYEELRSINVGNNLNRTIARLR